MGLFPQGENAVGLAVFTGCTNRLSVSILCPPPDNPTDIVTYCSLDEPEQATSSCFLRVAVVQYAVQPFSSTVSRQTNQLSLLSRDLLCYVEHVTDPLNT